MARIKNAQYITDNKENRLGRQILKIDFEVDTGEGRDFT